ncbi:MAG: RNA polymerase sigma factor [Deltaproteobacteria bacterium]|nr:MAG: RNA polymerase sigma factor [Deltaproteobacteria bacterium]
MQAYVGGDHAAFEELFRRHGGRLHAYFARTTGSDQAANDLVQQTFLQLHRARRDFRSGSAFSPWLYAIAANLRRDYHRYQRRHPVDAVDEVDAGSASPEASTASERLVRRCVGKLPEGQRDVVVLHWFHEFSMGEVADALGVGRSAVKVRAHRAYKALKACLEGVLA